MATSGSSGGLDVLGDIRQGYLTMIILCEDAPTFSQGGTVATGYASPSRGARDVSLWRLALAPEETSPPHTLSHEEVFLALDGSGTATLDGAEEAFAAGGLPLLPAGGAGGRRAGAARLRRG